MLNALLFCFFTVNLLSKNLRKLSGAGTWCEKCLKVVIANLRALVSIDLRGWLLDKSQVYRLSTSLLDVPIEHTSFQKTGPVKLKLFHLVNFISGHHQAACS